MWQVYLVAACAVSAVFTRVDCVDVGLTVDVAPGAIECFYQDIAHGVAYEVEYQVLAGGEHDIVFHIRNPRGDRIHHVGQKMSDAHKGTAGESGEYVFCLDNTFSQITKKTVYFELYVKDGKDAAHNSLDDITGSPELQQYDISLENFKSATSNVEERLQRSIQIQRQFAQVELRDRSVQEFNFERVNFWSGVQLFIMVSAAIVNVLMIRGLFSDRKSAKVHGGVKLRT